MNERLLYVDGECRVKCRNRAEIGERARCSELVPYDRQMSRNHGRRRDLKSMEAFAAIDANRMRCAAVRASRRRSEMRPVGRRHLRQ